MGAHLPLGAAPVPAGEFGPRQVIDSGAVGAIFTETGDIDGDGDQDILVAELRGDRVVWYENLDGQGGFAPLEDSLHVIDAQAESAETVRAADIDGDGDLDVLAALFNPGEIVWYENADGTGETWVERLIDGSAVRSATTFPADMDLDGDVDIIGTSFALGGIVWFANDGTPTQVTAEDWAPQFVTQDLPGVFFVSTVDMDGDFDPDILASGTTAGAIAWYENLNARGTFWAPHFVSANLASPNSAIAVDIDGDDDPDVLGSDFAAGVSLWWENLDGAGTFAPLASSEVLVTADLVGPGEARPGDLDGDGDQDIVIAELPGRRLSWYQNLDGEGRTIVRWAIDNTYGGDSPVAVDLDGDGDLDIVVSDSFTDTVCWYENVGPLQGVIAPSGLALTGALASP